MDNPGNLPTIHQVFPQLHVKGGAAAIEFYRSIFGAEQLMRLDYADGRVAHAELRFGPMTIMLADEHPEYHVLSPAAFGGSGSTIHLHVDDVDRLARRAVEAGAVMLVEPSDQGHGERQCRIVDPFGHHWLLGHQLEALSDAEIERRWTSAAE
ncbi:MAG: VOC family protein [Gemmatimonadota bacterium]